MPERYLGYDQPAAAYINATDPYERDHVSYGAGRRVCPGVHVAEKSMYLNMARLLWAFNFEKKIVDGSPVTPDGSMVKGWMSIPLPFECDIKVRGPGYAEIIEKEWTGARMGLDGKGERKD